VRTSWCSRSKTRLSISALHLPHAPMHCLPQSLAAAPSFDTIAKLLFKFLHGQRFVQVVEDVPPHHHKGPGVLALVFALILDDDNVLRHSESFMKMLCGMVSKGSFYLSCVRIAHGRPTSIHSEHRRRVVLTSWNQSSMVFT
jgi:hypothetical protein